MTITYDAAGLCTRCGSAGYYLGSYTSDSSFEDTRACIKPCPCHGWRPIEWAPKDRDVDLLMPVEAFGERRMYPGKWDDDRYAKKPRPYWGAPLVELLWGVRFMRQHQPTHFRPRPQPPDGV